MFYHMPVQSGDPASLDVEACIKDDHLILLNGKKIPILKSASLATPGGMNGNMPVVKGKVGGFTVIQESFVKEHQYTGHYSYTVCC